MKRTVPAFAAALAFASLAAHGAEYHQVQAENSRVRFTYRQMGVSMEGTFAKFSGQLRFDPAAPEAASATITVDLASVDTGSVEGDEEVATKSWFNTRRFPTAEFNSTAVQALGDQRYEVAGMLTIKGRTKEVVVPARFTPQGDTGVFEGSFTIQRGDFAVGEGAWRAFDIVANEVVIQFRISAAR